ncbi:hypothetical protein [Paenibacillus senegalensis]|uniref:hypothetical protein n=1 Tax=Paenibacillus senegalensis TaxID=1465766 RepID=UPI0002DE98B5|nr:hypothetical protein [Paenibacillus senegalensis]
MISLLSYIHTCLIRSYLYGPPTFVYILALIWIYSMGPNPIMESYAVSASFLFIISAVLCCTIIDIESPNQESVTLLHAGSLLKLYSSKLLYSWLFTLPLAAFAVLIPVVMRSFERSPSLEELGMALSYHAALSWLGVSLACWFSSKFIRSRVMSFLLLSFVIVITFCVPVIANALPERLKSLVLLFPPLNQTVAVLTAYDAAPLYMKLLAIGAPFAYGSVLMLLFLIVMQKRKLEYR